MNKKALHKCQRDRFGKQLKLMTVGVGCSHAFIFGRRGEIFGRWKIESSSAAPHEFMSNRTIFVGTFWKLLQIYLDKEIGQIKSIMEMNCLASTVNY